MKNPILIRKAKHTDATDITTVYLTSRKLLLPYAPLAHSDANVLDWIRDFLIPTNMIFVAEVDGKIVGMMALSQIDDIGWIDHLYLLPEAIGIGIGTIFISQAKLTLGSPIRLHTFQENHAARHFYEKNGFKIVALSDGIDNEERCPDALYEWRIAEIK